VTERVKLRRERLALQMHDIRLRYGPVVRVGAAHPAHYGGGTCIDCGWEIFRGQLQARSHWTNRVSEGFYAHHRCEPIFERSSWLQDRDYVDVFDQLGGLLGYQPCQTHYRQVCDRVLSRDSVTGEPRWSYTCEQCVREGVK